MKICIVGAGAIGGLLGARLAQAGHEVNLIARGAHLAAMRADGLKLRSNKEALTLRVNAGDSVAGLGPQDAVFIALKAYSIAGMLPRLAPLMDSQTVVIPAINGIPWWYFHKEGGRFDGEPVACIDPGGGMLRSLDCGRILGCVVHAAAEVVAPGVIEHTAGRRFILGEPDGSRSGRAERVAAALEEAGLEAPLSERIRDDVWTKLIGNLAFNPVCALTAARMHDAMNNPAIVELTRTVMSEGIRVGEAYGARFGLTIEERLQMARRIGNAKVSMMQDLERGRPIESEAIVGAVCEFARRAGVPTPATDLIYTLIRQRGMSALQQAGVAMH
jgi:2-dehydropantoate 2-reductase